MDLDRTILGPSLELTERLVAGVAAVRRTGVEPIVATGRMLRSSLPYARQLGVTAPRDLLPGRADRRPGGRLVDAAPPRAGRPRARGAARAGADRRARQPVRRRRALRVQGGRGGAGLRPPRPAPAARRSATSLPGLDEPTTKIVVVGESERMDQLETSLRATFDGRLFIAKSLPTFLEVARAGRQQGQRPALGVRAPGHRPGRRCRVRRRPERPRAAGGGGHRRRGRRTPTRSCSRSPTSPCPALSDDGVADFLHALAVARRVDSDAG